ncbi:hypothetical protein RSK20926_05807 [Roseobacter sp. SK209-2-6]|uniref:hypothetical protein n=1 Tax=Roseobacter sp. SK209-2-6 TaxID=388739 RepID=UPI0000F3D87C|nr:hypothetical protein [Roseobacter sp. SK209-2-6]EBA17226.1 hypothetical protein RSK20926_05807 [Roseobacter sp. SK209-2-6]
MTTYVPKAVQDALDDARLKGMKKKSRLRVQVGNAFFPVLRMWKTGFSVEEETAPQLRGLVDLFDGARHLSQCLIVASEAEGGEMRYEFKRATPAADHAPLDFYRAPDAPVGLLGQDGAEGRLQ